MSVHVIRLRTPFLGLALTIAGCQVSNTGANQTDVSTHPSPRIEPAAGLPLGTDYAKAQCRLDLVSGSAAKPNISVAHGVGAAFEGWAFIRGQPAFKKILLVFTNTSGNRFAVPADSGLHRDDVAQAFGDASLATAGFAVTADITDLPSGLYTLSLQTTTPDEQAVCDLGTQINVN